MMFRVNDIADNAMYGDPERLQAFFAWLRAEQPVAWADPQGYRPFWILSRHVDIRDAERRPDIFHAGPRSTLLPAAVEEANRQLFGVEAGIQSLVMQDGTRHAELRAMTQSYFLPKNIRNLEAMVDGLAGDFVDRLAARGGRCDIAADIVFWYPLRVAMTILGIGPDDEARMLKLTHELFGSSDPHIRRPGLTQAEHLVAVKRDYMAFFETVTRDRLANPRGDVSTLIAQGLEGERDLTPEERLGYYVIVATAGHDTTAASILGGLREIALNPALIGKLQAGPEALRTFTNEAIRFTAPVKHFMRTLAADCEIRGTSMRAGQHVMLSYGAATRDEDAFEDAHLFRYDRFVNNHLAFGFGPHQCLGQFLAKLEIEAFFRALLPRLATLSLEGPELYTEAPFVSGIRSMQVHYEMT